VEQRLTAVIATERGKAIRSTLLIVLCTPAFVVLASLVGFLVLAYVLRFADYDIDARGIYTGMNVFLAIMLISVLRQSNPPEEPHEFDRMWLAAAIVFILPLGLNHGTGLPEQVPVLFAIVYAIFAFMVLGLLGQVQIEQPAKDEGNSEKAFMSFLLALSSFITTAYGQMLHNSWLWFPPEPDELRVAAWILCKLAIEKGTTLETRSVPKRVLTMLFQLKLIQLTERKLELTLKGEDLVTADSEIKYVVKG
jgi:hypothetical protein